MTEVATPFYGVYRAVVLSVSDDRVTCNIPQVFADQTVTAFDVAGFKPAPGIEGFVAFESGWPDRPVWIGGQWEAPGGGGSGSGTRGSVWFEGDGPPPLAATVVFADDFERSSLGPSWVATATAPPALTFPQDFTISSGAAIGALDSGATGIGSIDRWIGSVTGNEYADITFTFPGSGPVASDWPVIHVYFMLDDSNFTCIDAELLQNDTGFRLRYHLWEASVEADYSYDFFYSWPGTSHTLTMCLVVTAAGVVSAYIGGVAVSLGPDTSYDFGTSLSGHRVGLAAWYEVGVGGGGAQPRIESVSFGTM